MAEKWVAEKSRGRAPPGKGASRLPTHPADTAIRPQPLLSRLEGAALSAPLLFSTLFALFGNCPEDWPKKTKTGEKVKHGTRAEDPPAGARHRKILATHFLPAVWVGC
jgi:hypothetical protein